MLIALKNRLLLILSALDPVDSLSEILYGLIMVLSITLAAGYYVQDKPDPESALMAAALGCNIAWGLIDGVMYVVTTLMERGRRNRTLRAIQAAPTEAAGLQVVRDSMTDDFLELLDPAEREQTIRTYYLIARTADVPEISASRADVAGGVAALLLNIFATLPASLPFVFLNDWKIALRLSNLVTIGMMFVVGYRWAQPLGVNPWKMGGALVVLGSTLVVIALALGG